LNAPSVTANERLRDRGVARRQAFLKAARTVFLENGYEAASVNDVVRLAGGSLATLYSQFGSKEGLFFAVASDQHDRLARDIVPQNVDHLPFEEYLHAFGESLLRATLSREHMAFYRSFIAEGRKFPELLKRYLANGAEDVRGVLSTRIEAWAKENSVNLVDADMLPAYFINLLRTRLHYRMLSEDEFTPTEEEIREHVAKAVRFFLRSLRA